MCQSGARSSACKAGVSHARRTSAALVQSRSVAGMSNTPVAVEGQANQDKGDKEPAAWLPSNTAFRCQYAMQFIAVLRGYRLPVDAPSATVLREAAETCPKS